MGKKALDLLVTNQYYSEFLNKTETLADTVTTTNVDTKGQRQVYEVNIQNTKKAIKKYNTQLEYYDLVKESIINRENVFKNTGIETYYYSLVRNYLNSYSTSATEYEQQIKSCKKDISLIEEKIESYEDVNEMTTSLNELNENLKSLNENLEILEKQKKESLESLESQQILSISQEMETIKSSIASLTTELETTQVQIENLANNASVEKSTLLAEKSNVANEKLTYQEKKKEYKNSIKEYKEKIEDCEIVATTSGYLSIEENLTVGVTIQEGTLVCHILPEKNQEYYAEIYVDNEDIANIKEGQAVNIEIAAYPSSEYGYFKGVVDTISKDIKVDENSGSAYYLVKVKCEKTSVVNKKGEKGNIINGMTCQAKIVVGNKSVLTYLMQKLDFID